MKHRYISLICLVLLIPCANAHAKEGFWDKVQQKATKIWDKVTRETKRVEKQASEAVALAKKDMLQIKEIIRQEPKRSAKLENIEKSMTKNLAEIERLHQKLHQMEQDRTKELEAREAAFKMLADIQNQIQRLDDQVQTLNQDADRNVRAKLRDLGANLRQLLEKLAG